MAIMHDSHLAVKVLGTSLKRLFGTGLLLAASSLAMQAQVSVTTYHNDIGRTGQNLNETILNTSDVNATQFGKLFSQNVDGYVYAQPLYLPNVTIGGQSHNVVFVATEHDSVYAFDADNNGGANATPLWFASMVTAAHGAAAGATSVSSSYVGTDIQPEVGITGTPVIDRSTGTLYVVSATLEGSTFAQRLHALDVTSGAEKFGGPVLIKASVFGTGTGSSNGVLAFDPEWENQRAGLLLLNGIVYIGFASHGDNGPWHGWVLGYNAQTLAQTGAFCDSHNGQGAGIWMAGGGLAADVVDPLNHPYGRMFIATGNGDYTASSPYTSNMDYGDSILNLDLSSGVPNVQDEFTPYNQSVLDANDSDQASGGVMVLPTQTTGSYPNLLVQAGKSGTFYLLNRDNLGGYNTAGDTVVQEKTYTVGANGAWSTPAYWNGNIYYWGVNDTLKVFPLANGAFTGPSGVSTETYSYPGATPSISANGNTQGIVWTIETDGYVNGMPAVLQAHSATSPGTTLYSSNTNATRDTPGVAVKFAVPTVANGKVYAGTETNVSVYGLLNGQQVAAAPVVNPAGESFNGTLQISMTDSTPGATIYYTLNGTTPTASSPVYSGPITLTASATIQAVASASGYLQSAVTTESYVDSSQVSTPVLSPGTATYTAPVKVAMSDSTTGAAIYYTTDGSTPTTSSTLYSGPVVVSSTQTINAIAVASGFANSAVASATYTLNIGQTGINFPNGFAGTTGVVILNGSTGLNDSRLQLTNGLSSEAGSAWYYQQVNVQAFTTEFSFQLSNPNGDGMTFAIQGQNINAVGQSGGGLGYQGIPSSIAVKFDLFSNAGEGPDSTGLYLNGASPTVPAIDLTGSGIDLHSGDTMDVVLSYNGTILAMTIKDLVTAATYTTSWSVNIPSIVGGNTAWVGFTGGTGGATASQKVLTWNYSIGSNTLPVVTSPTFNPPAGTYTSAQSVTISDGTAGSTIYYTTNGVVPTTSSSVYSTPITVSASETLQAMAVETGYTNSSIASAAYTLGVGLPAPTFSVPTGTYATSQSVTISDSVAGTTIYYTTNGTAPTTSSAVYSGPIAVSGTETLEAMAAKSGYVNSPAATAAYTFPSGGTIDINYPGGGFTTTNLSLVHGASVTGGLLQLTDGGAAENRGAWYATPVPISSFITDFTFQQVNASADGMMFAIQGLGLTAIGGSGGGLGFQNMSSSVGVKFDIFNNSGEGTDSTGLYTNGASPTLPSVDLTSTGVVLLSGDVMRVHMVYDGTNLTMTLTDTTTNATATKVFPVNIASFVGGATAYVGFTAGTGGSSATQNVISWTYVDSPGNVAAVPAFSPAAGTYTSTQSVTISDTTTGATVYYTKDGTTPTTASTAYAGAISVSSTQTLKAIAVASGYTTSSVGSAAYTIAPAAAATPTFSISPGTYTTTQTVTISDTTTGASIYYTTDGTTPTTSSTLYSTAVTVSATETLKAIAVATGFSNSAVASATYTISPPAATPAFSVAAGTYSSTQTVAISDTTTGAAIYYTTDGSTPTSSSTLYSTAITVSATETVKAIAVATGFSNSAVASATYTITTATPAFSVATGTYSSTQTVAISDTTTGAAIYYTTDGSTPTSSSTLYSTAITVSATETVKAIAVATGFSNSAVASATYTITPPAATPAFSISPGTYTTTQTVTISDTTTGATIYYTTDGGTPTSSSTLYSAAITVSATETVKAIAAASGFANSTVASATYTISPPAATPIFSVAAGTYSSTQTVAISDTTTGATIYYTTDGSTPTSSSTLYSAAITVSATETVKAIAVASGFSNSAVASAAYTITSATATPTFSVPAGTYTTTQTVTVADSTTGASIYYTTNGTTPTTSSTLYSGAIAVSTTETLKAIAVATGYSSSAVASAAYTITPPAATPTFSVPGGTYSTAQTVAISDTTTGASIYYTTNGTTPTTSSTLYSGAITVSTSETLQAIAVASGYTTSSVASAAYTITTTTQTAVPTFSPGAGTYSSNQSVTISDATPGATIYYTLNGTTPTTSSTVYKSPITIANAYTLQAIAVASGYTASNVASAKYTLVAATPVITPAAGSYAGTITVKITSATPTATIYYTTNGGTPTANSTPYSGAITVTASEKISAIAAQTGYTASGVASSTFTITAPVVPMPTFSVPSGTYTSAQTVSISNTTAGATIYYTTNGAAPTTSSSAYNGPVTVGTSETLEAIAVASGSTSAAATASYTINAGSTSYINFASSGFPTSGMSMNGGASVSNGILKVTDGGGSEARSAWFSTPVPVQSFITDFNFQQINGTADGMTFTIQGQGLTALGNAGGGLGYQNISKSVAVKFDLFSNSGEGSDSTGLYTSGASPTLPSVDLTSTGINLRSGDVMHAHLVYDGTNLTMTLTDTATNASVVEVFTVNIPSLAGGNTAYVGFTGGTGGLTVTQNVLSWSFISPATQAAATPTFNPAAGTYTGVQTVSINDATAGATIYYTTNGTTPTTSSNVYNGPISVAASETVQAIAVASGYSNSLVVAAAYTIGSGATTYIAYPNGGFTTSGLSLNGGAFVAGSLLSVTDGGSSEARSAWFSTPVPVQTFTTDFTFQQLNASADGMTFTIQGQGPTALGAPGGSLGYQTIPNSVAVKFDLFSNAGEGPDSTGLYTGGASPTLPSVDLSSTAINLHSGDVMHAHLVYDGTNLTMTLTDTVTNGFVVEVFPVNIPSLVGGNTAYVGFTGGTGGFTATQDILSWTYTH